jgi:hypothetical protein
VISREEDIVGSEAQMIIGVAGGVNDHEIEVADIESGTIEQPHVRLECGPSCISHGRHPQIPGERVGEGGMVAVGVSHEHGHHGPGPHLFHDRRGVLAVDRARVDHDHRAAAVVENPGVRARAGERTGVVGQHPVDLHDASAGR